MFNSIRRSRGFPRPGSDGTSPELEEGSASGTLDRDTWKCLSLQVAGMELYKESPEDREFCLEVELSDPSDDPSTKTREKTPVCLILRLEHKELPILTSLFFRGVTILLPSTEEEARIPVLVKANQDLSKRVQEQSRTIQYLTEANNRLANGFQN